MWSHIDTTGYFDSDRGNVNCGSADVLAMFQDTVLALWLYINIDRLYTLVVIVFEVNSVCHHHVCPLYLSHNIEYACNKWLDQSGMVTELISIKEL